jgi:hypothetical protein
VEAYGSIEMLKLIENALNMSFDIVVFEEVLSFVSARNRKMTEGRKSKHLYMSDGFLG